jgi:hypothetical protein
MKRNADGQKPLVVVPKCPFSGNTNLVAPRNGALAGKIDMPGYTVWYSPKRTVRANGLACMLGCLLDDENSDLGERQALALKMQIDKDIVEVGGWVFIRIIHLPKYRPSPVRILLNRGNSTGAALVLGEVARGFTALLKSLRDVLGIKPQ